MKATPFVWLVLAAMTVGVGGCSSPGGGAPAPEPPSVYLYVTDSDGISLYTVGAGGALSAAAPGTFTMGSYPSELAFSSDGSRAYVTNNGSDGSTDLNGVSAYAVGSGGALSDIAGGTAPAGASPFCIVLSPNGKFLYVTNLMSTGGANGISAYTVGSDGTLSAITSGTFTTGVRPEGIAISPDGNYLYVANNTSPTGVNGISAYTIGPSGALSAAGTYNTGNYPRWIAISPNGNYLYVTSITSTGPNGISAYTIGSGGALSPITTGTFATGTNPYTVGISPDGSYLYVTNQGAGSVSGYSIGSDGALSAVPGSPFAAGPNTMEMAFSPDGKYLYVTNAGSSTGVDGISAYAIGSDGALSAAGTFDTGADPHGITMVVR